MSITHPAQISEVTGGVTRSLSDKLSEIVSVKDYGAKGDNSTDDTAAIQAAINTGAQVLFPTATYKITNSLYLSTSGQQLFGTGLITIDNTLAKPCLWVGATDATGTDNGVGVLNVKIRGLRFLGAGARTLGSAGIAFQRATTTIIDSVYSWGFYAGIDIRGLSLVNEVVNADLRQNNYGFYDRADGTATINFQGSLFLGGRIEQNVQEGVILGSGDVRFIGTIVEGNSNVGQGGTGADPEMRLTPGFATGSVDLIGCYMETTATNTTTSMIQIDANGSRRLTITGGSYYGNDATNRYIVKSLSNSTAQSIVFLGGQLKLFKNYASATITNDCLVAVIGSWSDASKTLSADVAATVGAKSYQFDSWSGPRSSLPLASDVASGVEAIGLTQGQRILLGSANSYIYSDGTSRIRAGSGSVMVADSYLLNGGSFGNNQAASLDFKGNVANGATAKGNRFGNSNALSTAGSEAASFYSDGFATHIGAITYQGALFQNGVTFANLGTPANGTIIYCTDATSPSNPATGGGTGALCVRQNGIWKAL